MKYEINCPNALKDRKVFISDKNYLQVELNMIIYNIYQ